MHSVYSDVHVLLISLSYVASVYWTYVSSSWESRWYDVGRGRKDLFLIGGDGDSSCVKKKKKRRHHNQTPSADIYLSTNPFLQSCKCM